MNLQPLTQKQVDSALSLIVLAGIAFVTYADRIVVTNLSLGYLYLLPLGLSAFLHRPRITIVLTVVCVALREWFGPFSHDDLWEAAVRNGIAFGVFTVVLVLIRRLTEQGRQLSQLVRLQRDQLVQELEHAAAVQRRILPQRLPHRAELDIAARMYPARVLGGDFYDCFEMPNDRLGLVIADVSGKGASPALLMPVIMSTLRMLTQRVPHVGEVLQQLNSTVYSFTEQARYVSVFFGVLDSQCRHFEYANGGHHPPVLLRAMGGEETFLDVGGPVIGLLPEVDLDTGHADLYAGDLLVMYTDGLIEAEGKGGEQYGLDRLLPVVRAQAIESAGSILEALYTSAVKFMGEASLADDLTIIVCKRQSDTRNVAD